MDSHSRNELVQIHFVPSSNGSFVFAHYCNGLREKNHQFPKKKQMGELVRDLGLEGQKQKKEHLQWVV
jgi:hypothetical protein